MEVNEDEVGFIWQTSDVRQGPCCIRILITRWAHTMFSHPV